MSKLTVPMVNSLQYVGAIYNYQYSTAGFTPPNDCIIPGMPMHIINMFGNPKGLCNHLEE